jgi:hypothetical protein
MTSCLFPRLLVLAIIAQFNNKNNKKNNNTQPNYQNMNFGKGIAAMLQEGKSATAALVADALRPSIPGPLLQAVIETAADSESDDDLGASLDDASNPPPVKKFCCRTYHPRAPSESAFFHQTFLKEEVRRKARYEADSREAKKFISYFRVTFEIYEFLVNLCIDRKWFSFEKKDACGYQCDIELLVLGALYKVAHDVNWDHIGDLCGFSSGEALRTFSLNFYKKMKSCKEEFIYMPRNDDELLTVHRAYSALGFPGCGGSLDVVHIGWDRCPAEYFTEYKGKEKYPSIGYQVVCDSKLFIAYVSDGFPGARNDMTTLKYCEELKKLRDRKHFYSKFKYRILSHDGGEKVLEGIYLICDNGYLRWVSLMCPMKDASNDDIMAFSKVLESVRKDIERVFGILKKRFRILKNWSRQKYQHDIDNIFVFCCILHNLIITYRGSPNQHDEDEDDDGEHQEEGHVQHAGVEGGVATATTNGGGALDAIRRKMSQSVTRGPGLWLHRMTDAEIIHSQKMCSTSEEKAWAARIRELAEHQACAKKLTKQSNRKHH